VNRRVHPAYDQTDQIHHAREQQLANVLFFGHSLKHFVDGSGGQYILHHRPHHHSDRRLLNELLQHLVQDHRDDIATRRPLMQAQFRAAHAMDGLLCDMELMDSHERLATWVTLKGMIHPCYNRRCERLDVYMSTR